MLFLSTLIQLLYPILCFACASSADSISGSVGESQVEYENEFFPPLIDSDDIAYFFSTYDLDGLHWALSNIFHRSARNPSLGTASKELPQTLVARGGGDTYTSEYKLKHDLEQARYLVEQLALTDPETSKYFESQVIPIYETILKNIPPLSQLKQTKGLYAFTRDDYASGIATVYNKALYMTTADELDPDWRAQGILNNLDWDLHQRYWFDVCEEESIELSDAASMEPTSSSTPGVVVIDDILTPNALSIIRQLLLRNTHWFQTKTPLEFGKYVGSYIDDGLNDAIFLQLAKELHQSMPRIMKDYPLKYMWAYKYDSEWESGINLHADQAAINVNLWISSEGANLEEEGYDGGLVVFTAKPKEDWEFETYNTNTDFIVEELLRPTNFANVTIPHKPNRAVIFDSALFHQTDKYRFKKGYDKGRINLTLLFGEMQKGRDGGVCSSESASNRVKTDL